MKRCKNCKNFYPNRRRSDDMEEYINRETALKKLQMQLLNLEIDQDKGEYSELCENRGARDALDEAIYDIRTIKAADVQPVKHGYWIKQPEKFQIHEDVINSNYLYSCSYCNASDLHSERANNDGEVKFCWRCGARMDLKEGDAE